MNSWRDKETQKRWTPDGKWVRRSSNDQQELYDKVPWLFLAFFRTPKVRGGKGSQAIKQAVALKTFMLWFL